MVHLERVWASGRELESATRRPLQVSHMSVSESGSASGQLWDEKVGPVLVGSEVSGN
jgi:hypothetical protein